MERAGCSETKVVIIGAGDLGREIHGWFPELNVRGFLDASKGAFSDPGMPPVIGSPDTYEPRPGDVFVCAIGDPARRLAVWKMLKSRGAEFMTLIHSTAAVARNCTLGEGCIVLPYAIIDVNAHVGDQVIVYFRAAVGHDAIVGDGCMVLSNACVGARSVLGEGVTVSTTSFCNVGISIGDYAVVGAVSFAARDIPAHTTAIGVPARHVTRPASMEASTTKPLGAM